MTSQTSAPPPSYVAFRSGALVASGTREAVAVAVWRETLEHPGAQVLAFGPDGRPVDFDLSGSAEDVLARLPAPPVATDAPAEEARGRGRPKLGVVAREVTLLPRHWDWLSAQPGGASVTLRRLVEAARREGAPAEALRARRDAAYRFMSGVGGDLPGFEEASRALFAGDLDGLASQMRAWPVDVRAHVLAMLSTDRAAAS